MAKTRPSSCASIKNKKQRLITTINVYGPTSQRAAQDLNEIENFYDLNNTIEEHKSTSTVLICCDFNSKVGKRKEFEMCLGNFSRGLRNSNGQSLVD